MFPTFSVRDICEGVFQGVFGITSLDIIEVIPPICVYVLSVYQVYEELYHVIPRSSRNSREYRTVT